MLTMMAATHSHIQGLRLRRQSSQVTNSIMSQDVAAGETGTDARAGEMTADTETKDLTLLEETRLKETLPRSAASVQTQETLER